MADPFVAEIRIFPFNFPPKGWAFCTGKLMPISQNTALFSLLGTTYGGDGRSTFALPELQGNAPMHPGQGPGLSLHDLGEMSGSESVTLLISEIPSHSHTVSVANEPGAYSTPGNNLYGRANVYNNAPGGSVQLMLPNVVGISGGSQPHNNMQPYLALNFCIALQGIFPPRG